MKKIRLVLTALAFCGAVIGAFVSKAKTNSNPPPSVYAHTSTDCCVQKLMTLQQNCSVSNTGLQCTIFVTGGVCGPNQIAPAFNDSNCTFALRRP